MNADRLASSARELLRTESTFQQCVDYVDIAGRSYVGGANLVSWVLYTKADRLSSLTFALARLSCCL